VYLRGAICYRISWRDEARASFLEAREHIPAHPLAEIGLAATSESPDSRLASIAGRQPDALALLRDRAI
jgi:hypothetical protein